MDWAKYIEDHKAWSSATFGPEPERQLGVVDHIRKELKEIEDSPTDLMEWADLAILAVDGAWRSQDSAEEAAYWIASGIEKHDEPLDPGDIEGIPQTVAEVIEYAHQSLESILENCGCGPKVIAPGVVEYSYWPVILSWVNLLCLAMLAAKMNGCSHEQFYQVMRDKQKINFARKWPPPGPIDKATEHIRS